MTARGLSERRALAVVGMSASSLRYQPAPDRNLTLRRRIVALAHRHRRYGAGMIYLKLRQAGHRVNHKRVERLYTEAQLQVGLAPVSWTGTDLGFKHSAAAVSSRS